MNDNISPFNASEYDEKIKMTLPYYEDFYKQTVDVVNTQFNKPVKWLDIGCGTGKMEEKAFEKCDVESLVACDISEKMVSITQQRFNGKNMKVITSSVADLNTNEQFDVVTAVQVFHYLQKAERINAIEKCYKLLNANGALITFENFATNSEVGKRLFLQRWKAYQYSQGKSLEECNEHISRYGKAYFPITIEEHLQVFRQCGFDNAEVFWVSNMQVGIIGIK